MTKQKIYCYGIKPEEKAAFISEAEKHDYELIFSDLELCNDNYEVALTEEIIVFRSVKSLKYPALKDLYDNGLKCLVTGTAGYNNIDIEGAKSLGLEVSYTPGYSPFAISELALSLTLDLTRNVSRVTSKASNFDFTFDNDLYTNEIRDLVVGVIGVGRIGTETARIFSSLGAKVIGYDININKDNMRFMDYVSFLDLIKRSDVICIHAPYIKGVNDNLINEEVVKEMKGGVVIINVARGGLVDLKAIKDGLDCNKIKGFAFDVVRHESEIFGKKFADKTVGDEVIDDLIKMYPRVLVIPHVASYTYHAISDVARISFNNVEEYLEKGYSTNSLTKK